MPYKPSYLGWEHSRYPPLPNTLTCFHGYRHTLERVCGLMFRVLVYGKRDSRFESELAFVCDSLYATLLVNLSVYARWRICEIWAQNFWRVQNIRFPLRWDGIYRLLSSVLALRVSRQSFSLFQRKSFCQEFLRPQRNQSLGRQEPVVKQIIQHGTSHVNISLHNERRWRSWLARRSHPLRAPVWSITSGKRFFRAAWVSKCDNGGVRTHAISDCGLNAGQGLRPLSHVVGNFTKIDRSSSYSEGLRTLNVFEWGGSSYVFLS